MISNTINTRRVVLLVLLLFVTLGVSAGGVAAADEPPFDEGDVDISIDSDRFLWEQEDTGFGADDHEQAIEVTIENTHDVDIILEDADDNFASDYDSVSLAAGFSDLPIPANSEQAVILDVETGELDDGEHHDLVATFDFYEDGDQTNETSATLDEPLLFEFGTSLTVDDDDIEFGDIPIGTDDTIEIEISEEWDNADPENVNLETSTSDAAGAISIESEPESSFQAGGSTTAEISVEFPPTVTVGEEYTATFDIEDDRGGETSFDASAVAVPVDLEPTRDEISEYDSVVYPSELQDIASDSVDIIDDTDVTDVTEDELYAMIRFNDGVLRYLESSNDVIGHQDDGDHDAAQEDLVSAAIGFDAVREYADDVPDFSAGDVESDVNEHFETLLEEQETHYEQRLEEEEITVIENATIHRQLEIIADYSDNPDDAETYGNIADSAYDEYITAIETAETTRQSATDEWNDIEDDLLVTAGGVQLMINPLSYSEFQDRSDTVLTELNESAAAYETAGESSEALSVEEQHSDYESDILVVQASAVISGLIILLFVVGIVWYVSTGMFQYARDSQDASLGDFLH